jgi:Protein of unknown function (DUF3000)
MSPAGRTAPAQATQAAEIFHSAAADVGAERRRQAALRPELVFEDVPAPKKLAPFAAVLAATVHIGGTEIATGRLILLYDPACQPGWAGPFRIVAQIQAELDAEIAVDPLLGPVGWSWLTEALDTHAARYEAPSGTVTRVVTEGFGAKGGEPAATEFELRASWSPAEPGGGHERPSLAGHVAAWCDALCAAAGVAPHEPGVSPLPPPAARQRAAGRDGREGAGHRAGASGRGAPGASSGGGVSSTRGPAVT